MNNPPKIERLSAAIATLERRADYLDDRIVALGGGMNEPKSLAFDRAELRAITAALTLMKWRRDFA